jgi:hypothetical protein
MPEVSTLTALGLAALALAGAGAAYWLARRRGRQRDARAEYHHFRCPSCRRRLRFQSRQVGHRGKCSNCGAAVTFPPVSQSVD